MRTMKSFETWTQAKLESFCTEMRLKMLKKGEVLYKSGEFVRDWIFVSRGKLKIERDSFIEKVNFWPGSNIDNVASQKDNYSHKNRSSWVENK